MYHVLFICFKQMTSYEMRISDWSSDVCSSDLLAARVAGGLLERGAEAGSTVHLVLANSPAFVAVWLAAVGLGATIVPSDPGATAPELAGHIERTAPAVAVVGVDRLAVYEQGAAALSAPPVVVAVGEDDTELAPLSGHPVRGDRSA